MKMTIWPLLLNIISWCSFFFKEGAEHAKKEEKNKIKILSLQGFSRSSFMMEGKKVISLSR